MTPEDTRVRILIFTGDGKGKTTAALGMVLRAAGHGIKTAVLQFIKSDASTGECESVKLLPGVTLEQYGRGFVPRPDSPAFETHRQAAHAGLIAARKAIAESDAELIVLDEICVALAHDLITESEVLALLDLARPGTRLVLTGRGATPGLIGRADTVTEMLAIKHGMSEGIDAQKGVEW